MLMPAARPNRKLWRNTGWGGLGFVVSLCSATSGFRQSARAHSAAQVSSRWTGDWNEGQGEAAVSLSLFRCGRSRGDRWNRPGGLPVRGGRETLVPHRNVESTDCYRGHESPAVGGVARGAARRCQSSPISSIHLQGGRRDSGQRARQRRNREVAGAIDGGGSIQKGEPMGSRLPAARLVAGGRPCQ